MRSRPSKRLLLDDTVVVDHLVVADRPLARMRGLLGRSELPDEEGLWITPCPSIHMFFMRFPLDVVFVDRELRVVRIFEGLAVWKTARGGKGARSVFELPVGTIARSGIAVGSQLAVADA